MCVFFSSRGVHGKGKDEKPDIKTVPKNILLKNQAMMWENVYEQTFNAMLLTKLNLCFALVGAALVLVK